jgi:hypothetical protein
MHVTTPVSSVIASVFTPAMMDTLMRVSPGMQAGIHAVRLRLHPCPGPEHVCDDGLAGLVRDLGQPMAHHLTAPRPHPKAGWSVLLSGATATWPLASAATSSSAVVLHHLRLALRAGDHRGVVAFTGGGPRHRGLLLTLPSRRWVLSCGTARPCSAQSGALGSVARCRPLTYRPHTHPFRGG